MSVYFVGALLRETLHDAKPPRSGLFYPPLTTNVCNEAKLLLAAFKQKEKLASRKIRVSLGPRFSEPNVFVKLKCPNQSAKVSVGNSNERLEAAPARASRDD